jgi:hypothetical protein
MKLASPLLIISCGALLFVCGLVYDMVFVNIPYQDPTAAMAARYAFHQHIATVLYWLGAVLFAFGALAGIIRRLLIHLNTKP